MKIIIFKKNLEGGDHMTQFRLGNIHNLINYDASTDRNFCNVTLRYTSTDSRGEVKTKPRMSKKERKSLQRIKSLEAREKGFIRALPPIFVEVLNTQLSAFDFDVTEACNNIISRHNDLIKDHGIISGTKRFNSIRLYAINLLEGLNPQNPGFLSTGRKDRWPSFLKELRPLFIRVRDEKCSDSDRVIRSILYLNRLVQGNNKVDVQSIIAIKKIDKEFLSEFSDYLTKNVDRCSEELITSPSFRVIPNGPNNKPKWMTADVEAFALMNSELHDDFKNLCVATGNLDLYKYIQARALTHNRVDRIRLRYITGAYDKGNKSRVVAIGDYWTSVLLEPIMYDIQDYVERHYDGISYSKDHSAAFDNVKANIRFGDHSYDMVSWTDSFHSILQYHWMKSRYGKDISDSWWNLVAKCNWQVKGSDKLITYGTGQGMGIPVSFDLASITDLELLKFGYNKFYGVNSIKGLVTKVGDDLHCYDPSSKIHNMYVNLLDMEIQLSKTKSVRDDNLCAEIVSRNINNGVDVSRISANICRVVKKDPLYLPTLFTHLEEREVKTPLNLPRIFEICRVKAHNIEYYIRTLYLLTYFDQGYEQTLGSKLLRDSILSHYDEFINSDLILLALGNGGKDFSAFRFIYYIYCANKYMHSINDKIANVFDACHEFDSSELLNAVSEADKLWLRTDLPIESLTSIIMLSKSFISFNELYAAKDFIEYHEVLEALETTERKLTFKEMGVISIPEPEYSKQRVSRLFTLVKSISLKPGAVESLSSLLDCLDPRRPDLILSALVKSNLIIGFDDPIFGTIKTKVIMEDQQPGG